MPFVHRGSAYRAITTARPSSMEHIAWADRWLARFAGASADTLGAFDVTTGRAEPARALRMISAMAPASVFLDPPGSEVSGRAQPSPTGTVPSSRTAGQATGLSSASPAPRVLSAPRMDDDDVVPDAVFAAIAAAAVRPPSGAAGGTARSGSPTAPERAGGVEAELPRASRPPVDRLVHSAPVAHGSGMRVALGSSPIAPALAAIVPLPPVHSPMQSFDVRALSGSHLARAFLAGELAPDAPAGSPIAVGGSPAGWPTGGRFDVRPGTEPAGWPYAWSAAANIDPEMRDLAARAPSIELLEPPSYSVDSPGPASASRSGAPDALVQRTARAARAGYPATATSWNAQEIGRAPVAGYTHGLGSTAVRAETWAVTQERHAADLAFDFIPPELILAAQAYGFGPAEAAQAARLAVAGQSGLASLASAVDMTFLDAFTAQRARQGVQAARQPMAATYVSPDAAVPAGARQSGQAPGAEQTTAAEEAVAKQAAAATGPGASIPTGGADAAALAHPGASAGRAVFGMPLRAPRGAFLWPQATVLAMNLQAAQVDTARPHALAALDLLAANAVAEVSTFVIPDSAEATAHGAAAAGGSSAAARTGGATAAAVSGGTFLPAAAAGPGARFAGAAAGPYPVYRASSSIAPDTLLGDLPAGSVLASAAPMATYVTPDVGLTGDGVSAAGAAPGTSHRVPLADSMRSVGGMPGQGATPGALGRPDAAGGVADLIDSPAAAAVALGRAGALPAEFEALYVALSRSPAGRSMSPTVRAARALALAGSARGGSATARARAAAAWAVMPMVLTGSDAGAESAGATSPGAPGETGASGTYGAPDRPELQMIASRAGESLQSFVAPHAEGETVRAERGGARPARGGAVHRAPTAAQPLVRPGATSTSASTSAAVKDMVRAARKERASGSPEIPPWFEEAARRMFDTSSGEGISLAEMTLVTAAPAHHVAASPKTANASTRAPEAAGGSESQSSEPTPDVEQLAREVYAEICHLIEVARQRNGDTWR